MSATFRQEDYERVIRLFGMESPIVMQGDLSRRQTFIGCFIEGNPANSMLKSTTSNLNDYPNRQVLLYSNSRTAAEGSILERSDKILDTTIRAKGQQAICTSFTGSDGLKLPLTRRADAEMMRAPTLRGMCAYMPHTTHMYTATQLMLNSGKGFAKRHYFLRLQD